ncbi:Sec-independent protein translocase protein TatB [Croceicoccus gelatinilyticus]|uniref:Sec-independent protein translocase protein TatB n=1 Tax=Croceicoccus gelatinilyticus TaxID=2835536 RepID=UPI001BCA7941|nr:Sec-independent protein translocase protein TatB [Croceicoccus gelatinilyticus]MBS7669183.1 Sec-independent protein translocase protein TatB [Croceicoccus gelatinilyticus]
MFDIGATELLLIIVVAVLVIGPKDMPMALRTAGRWIGKLRKVSGHFRAGLDAMVREAEMEDMQKEWDRRNAEIMKKHPDASAETGKLTAHASAEMEPIADKPDANAEPAPAPAPEKAEATVEPETEAKPLVKDEAPEEKPAPVRGTLPLFEDMADRAKD